MDKDLQNILNQVKVDEIINDVFKQYPALKACYDKLLKVVRITPETMTREDFIKYTMMISIFASVAINKAEQEDNLKQTKIKSNDDKQVSGGGGGLDGHIVYAPNKDFY